MKKWINIIINNSLSFNYLLLSSQLTIFVTIDLKTFHQVFNVMKFDPILFYLTFDATLHQICLKSFWLVNTSFHLNPRLILQILSNANPQKTFQQIFYLQLQKPVFCHLDLFYCRRDKLEYFQGQIL